MAQNPLPVDLEATVLVLEADGTVRRRTDDEVTHADSDHQLIVVARAISVRHPWFHLSGGQLAC